MNNDTSNTVICTKKVEYVRYDETTLSPDGYRTATILVNKRTRAQQEMVRINKMLAGEPYLPCRCPNCRTSA